MKKEKRVVRVQVCMTPSLYRLLEENRGKLPVSAFIESILRQWQEERK